ncbi:hypothetical protein GCM10009837_68320 [Streptomyces durmitorensis]
MTVVERAAVPGGRAGLLEQGGYRIDTGPTVLTMPDIADEAFAAVGERLADRVDLIPLHPAYRTRFADGGVLDVHTGAQAMEAEIARFAGARDALGYRRLRSWLQRLYRVQMRRFIDTNFDSPPVGGGGGDPDGLVVQGVGGPGGDCPGAGGRA